MEATEFRQSNVSKHLNLMVEEGLLNRRLQGIHVNYALDDPIVGALWMLVKTRLQEESES